MVETGAFITIRDNFIIFAVASVMGIGVNFLSYLVIQYTSSLTMKILGTARNILTIMVGVVFYNETVTLNEAIGYGIALLGFTGYNVAKSGYFDTYQRKGAEKKVVDTYTYIYILRNHWFSSWLTPQHHCRIRVNTVLI